MTRLGQILTFWLVIGMTLNIPGGTEANRSFNPPPPIRVHLLNDLESIGVPMHHDGFELHLVVKCGAVFDPPGKEGAALLTARLIAADFAGKVRLATSGSAAAPIPAIVVDVTHDWIHLTVSGPPESLPIAGDCLAEALIRPEFSEDQFRRIKEEATLEVIRVEDSPEKVAAEEWFPLVFAPFPYFSSVTGSSRTLDTIGLNDIKKYFRRCVQPNCSILLLSSSLPAEKFGSTIRRYFGRWTRGESPGYDFSAPAPDKRPKTVVVRLPQAQSSCILMGAIGLRGKDEDFIATQLLAQLLQRRLRNLSTTRPEYRFDVVNQGQLLRGYFQIRILGPAQPDLAVCGEVMATLERLSRGEFSLAELDDLKEEWRAGFRNRLTSDSETIRSLLEVEAYRLGARYLRLNPSPTDEVIKEDLQFVAAAHFSSAQVKIVAVMSSPPETESLPVDLRPGVVKTWGRDPAPGEQ